MKKAIISWSGGKDSALALLKAEKQGFKIIGLLNFINKSYQRSFSHGLRKKMIKKQVKALALPLIQVDSCWQNYQRDFLKALKQFKKQGIKYLITGDISSPLSKNWVEKACRQAKIKPIFIVWSKDSNKILKEFIKNKFKTLIISLDSRKLPHSFLGKTIDKKFLTEIKKIKGVDPAGEGGEFHTFVFAGPIFKKSIKFKRGRQVFRKKFWFLDIK